MGSDSSTFAEITARAPAGRTPLAWLWSLGIALVCLGFSLVAFSPRLWLLTEPHPGTATWDRGLSFISQVEQPLGAPAEPAIVWRLAPVIAAKTLGLTGISALVLPWLGIVVMLALVTQIGRDRLNDGKGAALLAALVATTNATLTPTGWLGINDAWFVCALLTVAFVRGLLPSALCVLVGPWIDERFILALPLSLWVRRREQDDLHFKSILGFAILAVAAYAAIRLGNPFGIEQQNLAGLAEFTFPFGFMKWLPWASLGWFMGLRAAWILAIVGSVVLPLARWRMDWPLALLALAPLCAITLLASDTGRAPTMILPLVLLGAIRLSRTYGNETLRRTLTLLIAANVVLPAMHVTYQYGHIINSMPIEILRLIKPS